MSNLPSLAPLHADLGIPADYGSTRGLKLLAEAESLVPVEGRIDESPVLMSPEAASAWEAMRASAAAEGITLLALSGFRSVDRQTAIIRRKLAEGQRIAEILRLVAAPGYSEHHTGRALDIGCPGQTSLNEDFEATPAYAWLTQRAGEFGFTLSYPRDNPHGISYEPWHWLWSPQHLP